MLEASRPLLLIGGGKMGEALLAGWLAQGVPGNAVLVVEPAAQRREALAGTHGVKTFVNVAALPMGHAPSVLLLAVKPQVMEGVLADCAPLMAPDTLVLSIAAGKPMALFERVFGAESAIVRAMPNTPAAVGRGVTVLCANPAASPAQRNLAERLMRAVGEVHWVADEELMHVVTAVSGSGPAYVFHMIEAMAAAGVQSPDSAAQLRANVTSPGGTTAAALEVLMAPDGLGSLMARAVTAAARRSRELA
jgi:pyrroline-5-carboxylate reductase